MAPDDLTRLFVLLREQTTVDFTFYKPATVLRIVERRMAIHQAVSLGEYVHLMEAQPTEVAILCRELLIGVTRFFRDGDVFEALSERILPAIFEEHEDRVLRFWVAGCSTGEEAYTLAILARECMERSGRVSSLKIFATDVDRDALVCAGNGLYPESIAADLPSGILDKYFIRREEQYQVTPTIREMLVFAQHNLVRDPPFTNIELVSCRNLLIYLQPVLQQQVMASIHFSLNPNGILLLGTSEAPRATGSSFEPLDHKLKIYRSKGKKRVLTEGPLPQAPPGPGIGPEVGRLGSTGSGASHREPGLRFTMETLQATVEELETSREELRCTNEELRSVNEELHRVNAEYQIKILELTEASNDLENLLAAIRVGVLFLDENLEIRKLNATIGRIFRVRPGDVGRPLSHLAHNLAEIDMMSFVRRVESRKSAEAMEVRTLEGSRFVMQALPYRIGGGGASGVLLTFTEIGALKGSELARKPPGGENPPPGGK